jgi:hypothetical protein
MSVHKLMKDWVIVVNIMKCQRRQIDIDGNRRASEAIVAVAERWAKYDVCDR